MRFCSDLLVQFGNERAYLTSVTIFNTSDSVGGIPVLRERSKKRKERKLVQKVK